MALTTKSQSHGETQNSETQSRRNALERMLTRNTLRSFRATNSLVTCHRPRSRVARMQRSVIREMRRSACLPGIHSVPSGLPTHSSPDTRRPPQKTRDRSANEYAPRNLCYFFFVEALHDSRGRIPASGAPALPFRRAPSLLTPHLLVTRHLSLVTAPEVRLTLH